MIPDALLKISVLDGALILARHLEEFRDIPLKAALDHLRSGPALNAHYDYEKAAHAIQTFGVETFAPGPDRKATLRQVAKRLITGARPLWALAAPHGRARCRELMAEDTKQLLEYAGLFDTHPDSEVVSWWDQIGDYFRRLDQCKKLEAGREGEQRTLTYERRRLANAGLGDRNPVWAAIEDNSLGYDVLSWDRASDGRVIEKLIEVKSHSNLHPRIFVTHNEWGTALSAPDRYHFHVWNLHTGTLSQYMPCDLARHVPANRGAGMWQTVEIPIPIVRSPASTQFEGEASLG